MRYSVKLQGGGNITIYTSKRGNIGTGVLSLLLFVSLRRLWYHIRHLLTCILSFQINHTHSSLLQQHPKLEGAESSRSESGGHDH